MSAPTPDELRAHVVKTILRQQGVLGLGLYALVGFLLITRGADSVPDALWLAAGAAAQQVYGFLSNSKADKDAAQEVYATDPLPVQEQEPV